MELSALFELQGTLFLMILTGMMLRRWGIIDEAGKRCLTDLCVNVVIPCNIVKGCLMELDLEILRAGAVVLGVAAAVQVLCMLLNRFLYNRFDDRRKKVLQYCTLVSNGGFLGNPIAEGVYGSLGLLYASLFLIPTRIVMWSVGTSYFVAGTADPKKVLKNVLTHPCLVAVYLGLFLMVTGLPLPGVVESTVRSIGSCNSPLTMFIVGTVMAEVPLHTILNRTTGLYSLLRLVLLPLAALGMCAAVGLSGPAAGVCVLMTGMPAGATTAIFAARYGSDAPFAARCVVLSTLLSMLTIPVWCWLIG